MSRYRGPKLRITRRLGTLPGLTQKTSKKTATTWPTWKTLGDGKKKTTEYGLRLEEKQKLKFNYGISESQLYHYIKEATSSKWCNWFNFITTIGNEIRHNLFLFRVCSNNCRCPSTCKPWSHYVNNKVVDIPSFQCQINDIIGVKPKSTSKNIIENNLKTVNFIDPPTHLTFDKSKLEGTVKNYCDRSELLLDLNELLVIEYYSRR